MIHKATSYFAVSSVQTLVLNSQVVSAEVRGETAYREQHVLLVLVDSSGVRHRVSVLDHGDRLACNQNREQQVK